MEALNPLYSLFPQQHGPYGVAKISDGGPAYSGFHVIRTLPWLKFVHPNAFNNSWIYRPGVYVEEANVNPVSTLGVGTQTSTSVPPNLKFPLHPWLPATRHSERALPWPWPARQAGTRFTYPGGMKGWVDPGSLIGARPGIEPATAVHT